ncbi:MAG: RecX family transcriptional regulator [Rhodospirillaceae bacterium]
MNDEAAKGKPPRKMRVPRKATRKSLENAALYYLQRFSSSSENLRRVLSRRVDRSAHFHDTDPAEGREFITDIIEKLTAHGFLDDSRYAETRVLSLHRRGTSSRDIRMKLREKGVPGDVIDQALETLAEEVGETELMAAIALARRRRLGPYRTRGNRDEAKEKDLASLARAGFGYDTARRVIEAETVEALEEMLSPSP